MKRRITYRPNKVTGTVAVIWSGLFVLIGVFVVIPVFGPFGLLWTLVAASITGINAYQIFGKKYTGPEIHIEDEEPASRSRMETHDHIPSTALDAKRRLEQLQSLKSAGLIDGQEYRQKWEQILKEL